jgi:ATP-dependent RNA helicase RhlE
VLVFTRTKHGANKLVEQLARDEITAMAIHGNKSQAARTRALADFKDGKLQALIATDIAARGIDIDQLPHVVNYDLPNVSEDYVHRIGRTGRAGATGSAVSLVCVDERDLLNDIERFIKREIPVEIVPGFEPDPKAKPQPIQLRSEGHRGGGGGGRRPQGGGGGRSANGGGGGGNRSQQPKTGGQGQAQTAKPRQGGPAKPQGPSQGPAQNRGPAARPASTHRSGGRGR